MRDSHSDASNSSKPPYFGVDSGQLQVRRGRGVRKREFGKPVMRQTFEHFLSQKQVIPNPRGRLEGRVLPSISRG